MNNASIEYNMMQVETSILKSISYLYQNQLHYGEFRSYISPLKDMEGNCQLFLGSSPYITTFILYSISFVEHPKIKEMTQKALGFFLEEMKAPGIWQFFTTNRKLFYFKGAFVRGQGGIMPDLDDTACVSYSLARNNIPFDSNIEIILGNRNERGFFYTWLMGDEWKDGKDATAYTVPPTNDICCGVNANVLLYLGENEDTKAVVQYLNDVVLSNKEESCSIYFPDKLTVYYLLSRAYFNGISSLKKSRDSIVSKILAIQKDNGSFGDALATALAVCTLLNFQHFDLSIYEAIKFLISAQAENGSWPKSSFFISTCSHYGSEELTTAICIEALERCRLMLAHELNEVIACEHSLKWQGMKLLDNN